MQGKEASEQETKVKSNVGIDVSKCWLDVHVLPGDDRCASPTAAPAFVSSSVGCRITDRTRRDRSHRQMASPSASQSGGLRHSGCDRRSVSGAHVRQGARHPAKTDQLDARVLALFAAMMAPPVRPVARRPWQNSLNWSWPAPAPSSADRAQKPVRCGREHIPQASARSPHQQSRQGYCRTRPRDPQAHQGRRRLGQTLCHPDLHPELRLRGRRNPHRLPGRDRQRDRKQIGMLAGLAPIADNRAIAKVSASFGADAQPCAVSSTSQR